MNRTDTATIPIIEGELDVTRAASFPWALPPVTSTYRTPRARLARRWALIRRSQFAADVGAGWRTALAVIGVFGLAYVSMVLLRGVWYAAVLAGFAR